MPELLNAIVQRITANLLSQKGQAMTQYSIIPQLGLLMKSKISEKLKWHSTSILYPVVLS
jgi:hypothetical protein